MSETPFRAVEKLRAGEKLIVKQNLFFQSIQKHTHLKLPMMSETPFRAREKLIEKQKLFQSIHKHTHLKLPMDKITSVAIPLALAGSSLFLIGRGIYNMSHGIGKKA